MKKLFTVLATTLLVACGGGGSDVIDPPVTPPGPPDTVDQWEGRYQACDNGLQYRYTINGRSDTTFVVQVSYRYLANPNCTGAVITEAVQELPWQFSAVSTKSDYLYNLEDAADYIKTDITSGMLLKPKQVVRISGPLSGKFTNAEGNECIGKEKGSYKCFDQDPKEETVDWHLARDGSNFFYDIVYRSNTFNYTLVFKERD